MSMGVNVNMNINKNINMEMDMNRYINMNSEHEHYRIGKLSLLTACPYKHTSKQVSVEANYGDSNSKKNNCECTGAS
jgi:hypothetical protein